jgi:hypothetical protein
MLPDPRRIEWADMTKAARETSEALAGKGWVTASLQARVLLADLADEIDRLRAQIAAMQAHLDRGAEYMLGLDDERKRLRGRAERAEAVIAATEKTIRDRGVCEGKYGLLPLPERVDYLIVEQKTCEHWWAMYEIQKERAERATAALREITKMRLVGISHTFSVPAMGYRAKTLAAEVLARLDAIPDEGGG